VSVCYRGRENDWGNMNEYLVDINQYGDGSMGGGAPYICSDFNFAENKITDNYKLIGILCNWDNNYIKYFGYGSAEYDWIFIATMTGGTGVNDAVPVGDKLGVNKNHFGYAAAMVGGNWVNANAAGIFNWHLGFSGTSTERYLNARLVYYPQT
jgi:hypothetical protein